MDPKDFSEVWSFWTDIPYETHGESIEKGIDFSHPLAPEDAVVIPVDDLNNEYPDKPRYHITCYIV